MWIFTASHARVCVCVHTCVWEKTEINRVLPQEKVKNHYFKDTRSYRGIFDMGSSGKQMQGSHPQVRVLRPNFVVYSSFPSKT